MGVELGDLHGGLVIIGHALLVGIHVGCAAVGWNVLSPTCGVTLWAEHPVGFESRCDILALAPLLSIVAV